ncbi:MAG: cytidylate kinase family protein [Candidatus Pacebacteria bacterium]|nr:cytidylate kinase family protein [Candidatus Paceibacterota bacterium]MCD8508111.1 cytidylate kinase family protein [Candidatus Paceibacterota bacterium]MCD8527903.1 cytidylate kinase family protein [Candidatus Paceibacterota bacterium]MCD8563746.1 cytidylate kinase family protein [Candidatus Paceibacterota bacterium]
MHKEIITLAGKLGSGKSSTAKRIAAALEYTHYSSGDFARAVARDHGMTITEWNTYAEAHPEMDHEVDAKNKEMARENKVVIDSRLAFHFIPESFKVFLDIDASVAAERIFKDLGQAHRSEEHQAESIDELTQDLIRRAESEVKRYQDLYNVHPHDHRHFDLIINTGLPENTLDHVVQLIITAYTEWLTKK